MFGNNIFKVSLHDVFYVLDTPLCIYLRSLLLNIFFYFAFIGVFFNISKPNYLFQNIPHNSHTFSHKKVAASNKIL